VNFLVFQINRLAFSTLFVALTRLSHYCCLFELCSCDAWSLFWFQWHCKRASQGGVSLT